MIVCSSAEDLSIVLLFSFSVIKKTTAATKEGKQTELPS
jgi:hypothetical protein